MKSLIALAIVVCTLAGCAVVPAYPAYPPYAYGPPVYVGPTVGVGFYGGWHHHW